MVARKNLCLINKRVAICTQVVAYQLKQILVKNAIAATAQAGYKRRSENLFFTLNTCIKVTVLFILYAGNLWAMWLSNNTTLNNVFNV